MSSFGAESAVLLHMVAAVDRSLPVIFLDTGRLFAQTMLYRNELAARLGLTDVRTVGPEPDDADRAGPASRPVLARSRPLLLDPQGRAAGRGADAVRRLDHRPQALPGGDAAAMPPFEADAGRIKVNPLADWAAGGDRRLSDSHALPPHPLVADGYPSIGCLPCTSTRGAGRGCPRRALARPRQDRMRHPWRRPRRPAAMGEG